MNSSPADVHGYVRERIDAVLSAALRADAAVGDALPEEGTDPYTQGFLRDARRLTLACAAALTAVLEAHRPGPGPYGEQICRGCGEPRCRTLGRVAGVLAAYAVRPPEIDRAEAWRRADRWLGGGTSAISLDEFADGFIAEPVPASDDHSGPVAIIDRRTGRLTQWPRLPRDTLITQYARYLRGEL